MRPAASQVLFGMFLRFSELSEESADDYARGELRLLGILAALLAVDADRAASVRVAEIDALRPLLERGAEVAPELASSLRETLQGTQGSGTAADLTIGALEARLEPLQRAFVTLQEWLEEHPDTPGAADLLTSCWRELAEGVRRRAVPLP